MPTIVCGGVEVELMRECWTMPKVCPCCGTAVVRQEGFVAYKCPNKDCKDQAIERMRHAVGKSSLDWDGFGDAQALELISAGYTTLSSLFAIDEEKVKLLLKGSAARKFLKERERVKSQPLWRKLHALGIEMLGTTSCKELASRFASIEEICDHVEETTSILGEVRAGKFWAAVEELVDEIAALDNLGLKFAETRVTGVLSGKTFCITGTLMSGTRDQVAKRIEDAGGIVKGSVGKTLSYLVMGEAPGANKALAAKKYNVPIIAEEQLYALIGIPMPTPPPSPDERDY